MAPIPSRTQSRVRQNDKHKVGWLCCVSDSIIQVLHWWWCLCHIKKKQNEQASTHILKGKYTRVYASDHPVYKLFEAIYGARYEVEAGKQAGRQLGIRRFEGVKVLLNETSRVSSSIVLAPALSFKWRNLLFIDYRHYHYHCWYHLHYHH